MSSIDGVELSL